MALKQRSALVIVISSAVIASVLALTIFGFYAYLRWKEKNMEKNYKLATYDLDAHLFEKYIVIDAKPKIAAKGTHKGKPVVEGTIKNTTEKRICSLKMKIAFCNREGEVVYVDRIYPVGVGGRDSISFACQLKNCPPEVLGYLKSKSQFVKAGSYEPLEFIYKVEGLDIR